MTADLRSFLAMAEDRGHLLHIRRPVDADTQAGALMIELERRAQVGLFENIVGRQGRLAANLLGRRDLLAAALGVAINDVVPAFQARLDGRIPTTTFNGPAPSQEIVCRATDADLRRLPFIVHASKDAGAYITSGIVLARDPESGRRNVSINRVQIKSALRAGIRMMPPQQLGILQSRAETRHARLPIAIAIGNHPLDLVAAATTLPLGEDELELAGALRGAPFPLAPAVSQDGLEVPALAEVVVEGFVEPGVREPEGPFGDFMQFYVPRMENHVFVVTAITHRRDPILQAIHAGSVEDTNLLGISREAQILFSVVAATGARVRGVRLLPTILGCAISIEQRHAGEAMAVGTAALDSYAWLKYCVIVDHDVDVNRVDDVWWALQTRGNPAEDITIIPGTRGFPRDPFGTHTSKAILDATIPVGEWQEFERKHPPLANTLRLEDFL